mmetsp:Transcript_49292/g.137006  ORF Transcript_49292/g.137006 Transcript_49292/m.137006 type:complete len:243 (-) Transcript_49292:679-1407(-)
MTGRFSCFPASNTAFTVLVLVQLKAGIAKPLNFAYSRRVQAASPVMTPFFMPGRSQKLAYWAKGDSSTGSAGSGSAGSVSLHSFQSLMLSWSTNQRVFLAWTMEAGQSKPPFCSARQTIRERFSDGAQRTTRLAAQMKSMLAVTLALPPSSGIGSTTLPCPVALIWSLSGSRRPALPSSPGPNSIKSTEGMPPGEMPTMFLGWPRRRASYAAAASSGEPSPTLWTFSSGILNLFMKLFIAFL